MKSIKDFSKKVILVLFIILTASCQKGLLPQGTYINKLAESSSYIVINISGDTLSWSKQGIDTLVTFTHYLYDFDGKRLVGYSTDDGRKFDRQCIIGEDKLTLNGIEFVKIPSKIEQLEEGEYQDVQSSAKNTINYIISKDSICSYCYCYGALESRDAYAYRIVDGNKIEQYIPNERSMIDKIQKTSDGYIIGEIRIVHKDSINTNPSRKFR